jgi:hypothetical protein
VADHDGKADVLTLKAKKPKASKSEKKNEQ